MVSIQTRELNTGFKYELASLPGGENIKRCFACGACSGGCMISETVPQFDPRKIIRMVLFGMKEEVLSSPSIWLCLLCHNCSFHCVQDVKFSDVIGALRYTAVKEGYIHPTFIRWMVFRALLPSHTRLELFSRPLSLYQLLGLPSLLRKTNAFKLLPDRLGNMESMLPPVPFTPLRRKLKVVSPPEGKVKQRVGFFLGCADDLVFHSAGMATISVLNKNSCEVVTPGATECCGMPCLGYGEFEQARKLARHNIDVFEKAKVEAIISDCATCGSFLKGYADLLKDDPVYNEKAQMFSRKVQDISEFIVQTIDPKQNFKQIEGKFTYHDSCHLLWGQGISSQPRQILHQIPGLELIEMKDSDRCCGGAGSYNMTHYETSMEILDKKMANVAATGADLVVTGCPGCRIQLRLGVKRRGLNARVVHSVELLNQAYQGEKASLKAGTVEK